MRKIPVLRTLVAGAPHAEIVPDIAPLADELVITKQYASAFFGTDVADSDPSGFQMPTSFEMPSTE